MRTPCATSHKCADLSKEPVAMKVPFAEHATATMAPPLLQTRCSILPCSTLLGCARHLCEPQQEGTAAHTGHSCKVWVCDAARRTSHLGAKKPMCMNAFAKQQVRAPRQYAPRPAPRYAECHNGGRSSRDTELKGIAFSTSSSSCTLGEKRMRMWIFRAGNKRLRRSA